MRNRIAILIAAVPFLFISLFLAVPPCFGQDGDIQDILDDLQGLQFDQFIDASYKQVLLRSPELVTSMGLSETLGIGDDQLDTICNEFIIETYELEAGILEILETYDREALSYEQQISYDSYSWILEGWAVEHEWMYHFYPVTHGFSRQNDLFRFFEDEHPLETYQNALDYVSRLQKVAAQFRCLRSNLDDSEARGILAPAQMLQLAADRIRWVVPGVATDTPFYTTLATKTEDISELTEVQRQNMLIRAEQAINNSVIPAYQALVSKLDQQVPRAPAMNGVWQLPDGDDFYDARVRHHTTTELTPAQIHQKGLDEVERIRGEILEHFVALGYPTYETFQQLYARVAVDSGIVRAADIVPLNESFIRQAQEDVKEVFDIEPKAEVIVIGGSGGGFYVHASLDGSRPGAYYIGNQTDDYRYWMRTIAYHEAVPGHHFQIAIGNEQDVPLFTKGGGFYTAFVEGWALYAELLAKEMGWYEDDVYSELGRLQWELLRAARLVVDTGLHHYRWSRQQAIDYYVDTVGTTTWLATGQIDLYLYYVGYFTAYKTGMLKILELREHAMDELGDDFDIKDFHRAVLLHNRLPLPLLERLIDDYIEETKLRRLARIPRRVSGRRGAVEVDIWRPSPGTSWQWQLEGTIDTSIDVDMYDIDLFDVPEATIADLKAAGRAVICYFSAGSWEDWRPDAEDFPALVLGDPLDGWPGERWVDIRRLDLLGPILEARLDLASTKGCAGVEPDNVDAYQNSSGFPLTSADQLVFNRWIASQAHQRGLSVGLKNDLDQVADLQADFDWAINEQCYQYTECDVLQPFIDAGKAVFGVEYAGNENVFCPYLNALGYSWLKKNLALDAWRIDCQGIP